MALSEPATHPHSVTNPWQGTVSFTLFVDVCVCR